MTQYSEKINGTQTLLMNAKLNIGAVAKRTGISVHTLRAWEKRHNALEVTRTESGRRLYKQSDVSRLTLLKRLIDLGNSIGNIAHLETSVLQAMVLTEASEGIINNAAIQKQRPNVILWGQSLIQKAEANPAFTSAIQLISASDDLSKIKASIAESEDAVAILEFDSIHIAELRVIRSITEIIRDNRLIILFKKAHRELIQELRNLNLSLLRHPVNMNDLLDQLTITKGEETSIQGLQLVAMQHPTPHQFTPRQLRMISSLTRSEPSGLSSRIADIVRALTEIESHCQHDSNFDNDQQMAQKNILKLSANARTYMENALAIATKNAGISLDTCSTTTPYEISK